MKINYKIKGNVITEDDMKKRLSKVPHATGFRRYTAGSFEGKRTIVVRTKEGLSVHERQMIQVELYKAFRDIADDVGDPLTGVGKNWLYHICLKEGFRLSFGVNYIDAYLTHEDKV